MRKQVPPRNHLARNARKLVIRLVNIGTTIVPLIACIHLPLSRILGQRRNHKGRRKIIKERANSATTLFKLHQLSNLIQTMKKILGTPHKLQKQAGPCSRPNQTSLLQNCNELVFKSIGHYSSTPEHRTMCSTCSACSAVCFRFNQGTIDLCLLSVSLPTRLPQCS